MESEHELHTYDKTLFVSWLTLFYICGGGIITFKFENLIMNTWVCYDLCTWIYEFVTNHLICTLLSFFIIFLCVRVCVYTRFYFIITYAYHLEVPIKNKPLRVNIGVWIISNATFRAQKTHIGWMFTTPIKRKGRPGEGRMTTLIIIVEHRDYSFLSKYNL